MFAQMKDFWRDEDGVTAIEYGLIAGLIAVGIILSIGTLGKTLAGFFTSINDNITAAQATED